MRVALDGWPKRISLYRTQICGKWKRRPRGLAAKGPLAARRRRSARPHARAADRVAGGPGADAFAPSRLRYSGAIRSPSFLDPARVSFAPRLEFRGRRARRPTLRRTGHG